MRGISGRLDVVVAAVVVVVTAEVVVGPEVVVVLLSVVVVGEPESPQAANTRARANESERIRRIHRG
jgi:hypothetical protein